MHSENETPVLGILYLFWVWKIHGGSAYFDYFFQDTLRSATLFEWSRRELSIDVAEH